MALKCIFLGDSGVGKTSLFNRLSTPTGFDLESKSTVAPTSVTIKLEYIQKEFNITLVDTAGQETYRAIAPSYIRDSTIILFCFQKDRPETFNNLSNSPEDKVKSWVDTVKETKKGKYGVILVLTQSDKEVKDENFKISSEQINELREKIKTTLELQDDVPFIETSAKDNNGIGKLQDNICKIADKYPNSISSPIKNQTTFNCCK